MRYPAGDQDSPQPTALYSDPRTGDIYLADASTHRIAIYDSQRRFNFEFSTNDRLTSPRQIAVDSLGRIFVLGDDRQHSFAIFDYNGEFLSHLDLLKGETRLSPSSFAFDLDDRLFALTGEPFHSYVFTTGGEFLTDFPLMAGEDSVISFSPIYGNLTIQADRIILPLSMVGLVAMLDLDGKLLRYLGVAGGGPGELSFPIAACILPDGNAAVLDKHRHLVQLMDGEGNLLKEIGYCGLEEGTFFHPTNMIVCADGALAVGQIYKNRIQQLVFQEPPVASGP